MREILASAPGVKIVDNREANHFPMPLEASGQDDVLVGRIRQDISRERAGRPVRRRRPDPQGRRANAVQIAEKLAKLEVLAAE